MGAVGDNPEATAGAVPALSGADRFPVEVPGYCGSLEQLLRLAQRGEADLAAIPIARITGDFRAAAGGGAGLPPLRDIADFLTLSGRLLALKAGAVGPEGPGGDAGGEDAEDPGTEAGRRLAEYQLFKRAAEALLTGSEGELSFLGLVSPEVIPSERLRIDPHHLVTAFRTVLERLSDTGPILPVGVVTFSVEDKVRELRARLREGLRLTFDDVFSGVSSRLEAVACFLALLDLLRAGAIEVEQSEAFGVITVTLRVG